jgi:AraC-like DNA-binding protein/Tfp pilus assembly protein PilF
MKSLLSSLLLLLISFCATSQQIVLDSLLVEIRKHQTKDTARVTLLNLAAAKAWGSNPQLIDQLAKEALDLAQGLNFERGIADSYKSRAIFFWSQTDYTRTIEYSLLALKIYEQINNQIGIVWSLGTIGLSHAQAYNYDQAIDYQARALTLAKKINDKIGQARNLNNLGYVFEQKKEYDKSLAYYKEALKMRELLNDKENVLISLSNVGGISMLQGNYSDAKSYFENCLILATSYNNKNMLALINQNLGDLYLRIGLTAPAEDYLSRALKIAQEISDKKRIEEVYNLFIQLEKSRGNYKDALKYQELHQSLRDTLYSQERRSNLAQFESRFEVEKSEHTIQLLQRDKKISNLWRSILIAGITVLTIFFVVLYLWQNSRYKKNIQVLDLQVDLLTSENQELANKYKLRALNLPDTEIESSDQKLLKKAITLVEINLSDSLFGVEKMAREMGMSRASLHRKLKSITGFAPSEFIRNIRLKRAANLLRNEADSVAQIGFAVGFEDQSYFSKSFKKQFGVTPSEYSSKADSLV